MGRCRKRLIPETALFLVFFLLFLVRLMLVDGFAVNPETQEVFMQPYKYFINLIEMPAVLAVLLVGVVLVLFGIVKTILSQTWRKGIWFAGTGPYSPYWPYCSVPVGTTRLIIRR